MAHLEANRIRQAALPAVASLAGAGLGLLLTRGSKAKEVLPGKSDFGGVGDLAEDLRRKLDAVRGKLPTSVRAAGRGGIEPLSAPELERRRGEREERRKQRHARG
jgi:hypothetical protein